MPQLYRSGLAGVVMITCVNPQADDYDETLTVLGTECSTECILYVYMYCIYTYTEHTVHTVNICVLFKYKLIPFIYYCS